MTFGTGEDEQPPYSPDGKWIVFESNRDLPEQRHLWVVPAGGGQPHRLTKLHGEEDPQEMMAEVAFGDELREDGLIERGGWRSTGCGLM